ncbi:MAG: hypothetical protein AAGG01_11125 [Planctomycetota bacterium]
MSFLNLDPCTADPAPPPVVESTMTPVRTGASLVLFGLLMLLITEALARMEPELLLGEGGPIELGQLVLLLFALLIFWRAGRIEGAGSVFTFFSAMIGVAIIRELDGPLDQFWHGAWKVPAGILASATLIWGVAHRCELKKSSRWFATSPAFGLMIAAGAVVLLQSRLLGRQSSWQGALDARFVRDVPRLVEETSELGGYALILWAAMEARRWAGRVWRTSSAQPLFP